LAKNRTRALQAIRSQYESRRYNQGIGYYVPEGVSREEWHKLVKTWNEKLAASGHHDIEQFSPDCSGRFSSVFYKDPQSRSITGSSASVVRRFKYSSQEFYRRLGLFRYHAPINEMFKGEVWRIRGFLKLWSEGATTQELTNWLNNHKRPSIQQKISIWSVHYRTKEIAALINKWWLENEDWLDYE
jgi:hypothetical protein